MKWKWALGLSFVLIAFAFAAEQLPFCTSWCEVPASMIKAPGALLILADAFGPLDLPFREGLAWLVTFVAWFLIFLLIGFGARKVKER